MNIHLNFEDGIRRPLNCELQEKSVELEAGTYVKSDEQCSDHIEKINMIEFSITNKNLKMMAYSAPENTRHGNKGNRIKAIWDPLYRCPPCSNYKVRCPFPTIPMAQIKVNVQMS